MRACVETTLSRGRAAAGARRRSRRGRADGHDLASPTRIFATVPAAGDGISTVVLSVWISTSGSSSASPSPFGHEPARDLALGEALTEVRELELVGHRRRSLPAGRADQASAARPAPGGRPRHARARSPARRRELRRHRRGHSRPGASGRRSRSRSRSSCSFSGSGTSVSRSRDRTTGPREPRGDRRPAAGITRRRGSSHRTSRRWPSRGARSRARRARARAAAVRSQEHVVAKDGEDAERQVHHLRHAQVDDDRRERERLAACEAVLALQQVEHPLDRDPRRAAEVLVEAECEPGAVNPGDRPLDLEVVADVESERRRDRGLIAVPETSPSPCAAAVAGGEAGRRRESARRASCPRRVPCSRCCRHQRRGGVGSGHPVVRRRCRATLQGVEASRTAPRHARRLRQSQSIRAWRLARVTPHGPGTTSSIRTASTCPRARRAPRSDRRGRGRCRAPGHASRTACRGRCPSPRSGPRSGPSPPDREHGLELTRGRSAADSSGSSCSATRSRAACAPRRPPARATACRRPRSASTGTARRSRSPGRRGPAGRAAPSPR